MGTLKSKKMKLTEKDIQGILCFKYLSNPVYVAENLYVFSWESDFLAKTKAGYWYEVEIKVSKSDFKADLIKKEQKHEILKTGASSFKVYRGVKRFHYPEKELRPNYFTYCVPEELVDEIKDLVPEYAGLVSISSHGYIQYHKSAPQLHRDKISDESLSLTEKFYYNYRSFRAKYAGYARDLQELRNEIKAIKAEFKAVTGFDYEECL